MILYQYTDTCDDEATCWPGVVHGHSKINLPLPSCNLHGPDEGGSVASNGHGPSHPPGEHEHWVPGDEWCDQTKHQHGHTAHPDSNLATISIRHQTRAERSQSKASEEEQLCQSLEPGVLADQVPLRDHCGLPELVIKLIVHTPSNTVTQHFLVLSHVSRKHLNTLIAILHCPGRRNNWSISIFNWPTPEPLLGGDETSVEYVRQTWENRNYFTLQARGMLNNF